MLLGRRDEALDELRQLDAWDVYERDLCRALCAVGGGDPAGAAAALADSARRHVSGRLEFQECDYLSLFGAFRFDTGDQDRAEQLVDSSRPRFPMVHWLVWPHVGGWTPETFIERNAATRAKELARMADGTWDGTPLARLLDEELAFWSAGR